MSIFFPAPRRDNFFSSNNSAKIPEAPDALLVGTSGSKTTFRSVLKFDLKTIPKRCTISSAELRLYIKHNEYPYATKIIDVYRLLNSFSHTKIIWSKAPQYVPELESSAQVGPVDDTCVSWDITELVHYWRAKGSKNRGIMLKVRDETQCSLLAFASRKSPALMHRPSLTLTFADTRTPYSVAARPFYYHVEYALVTQNDLQPSLTRQCSPQSISAFWIQNKGSNPATVVVQSSLALAESPWFDEGNYTVIHPGEHLALATKQVGDRTRVAYKSANPGNSTLLDIWFLSEP
ncbi:MAG: DNRLRE domain-containing protein [Peptococcaceae bacterium]|nr:DNRLRE domain-containing protein [Peptococcaceae bacterium]